MFCFLCVLRFAFDINISERLLKFRLSGGWIDMVHLMTFNKIIIFLIIFQFHNMTWTSIISSKYIDFLRNMYLSFHNIRPIILYIIYILTQNIIRNISHYHGNQFKTNVQSHGKYVIYEY